MTEHEYLKRFVFHRYFAQIESLVDSVHDFHKECLIKGNYPLAIALEKLRNKAQQELLKQRARAEDIIIWLEMDTKLREIGQSYPDLITRR